MARGAFAGDVARDRMRRAVEAVEGKSSAEVVVSVRPQSAPYRHAPLAAGAALGYLALLYTLFSPQVFGLPMIALVVPAAFGLGATVVRVWPRAYVALAGRSDVHEAVRDAAGSAFVELAVSRTRDRSGILVYVSLLERRVRVLADVGVKRQVPGEVWSRAVADLEGVLQQYDDDTEALEALAKRVEGLGPTLAPHLPRRPDDQNELEDVAW